MNLNAILTGNLPPMRWRLGGRGEGGGGDSGGTDGERGNRVGSNGGGGGWTEHPGSFRTVNPSEASAGDCWSMSQCERRVTINIWDSLRGSTLMMLLA